MQGSAFLPELDDQLWRLRIFGAISGTCLGAIVGLTLALIVGAPGAQGMLPRVLGMTAAVVGWLAAREVHRIKALLDEMTQGPVAVDAGDGAAQQRFDICLHCGSPLREGLAFCTSCGQRLEDPGHG